MIIMFSIAQHPTPTPTPTEQKTAEQRPPMADVGVARHVKRRLDRMLKQRVDVADAGSRGGGGETACGVKVATDLLRILAVAVQN